MSWGYVAVAAATLISGAMSADAQGDAADAALSAEERAEREQRRQFDLIQQNNAPYLEAGQNALGGLDRLMSGDYSGFQNSPDYLYARQQMQQGLDRSAASRGRLYSGGYGVDMAGHLGGLASQNLGSYRGFLQNMANLGQNSANMQGQAGMGMANSLQSLYGNTAQAQGNAAVGQANAWGGALGGLAGLFGDYMGSRNQSSYSGGGSGMTGAFNGAWGYT